MLLTRAGHKGHQLYEALRPGERTLPSFLVIGAKRSGSTSLYHLIAAHPGVRGCLAQKGTHFFDVRYERGWEWYRAQFPRHRPGVITGEASPYYMFHPLVPDRIAQSLPDVKLVAILRDPVERAHSAYRYEQRAGREPLSFEGALAAEEKRMEGQVDLMRSRPGNPSPAHRHHGYLARGRYVEQLEVFLDRFPAENLLVLQAEAFYADPAAVARRLQAFLGLAPAPIGPVAIYEKGHYAQMDPATRERLREYFSGHNERLYALPVVDFRWDYGTEALRAHETTAQATREPVR